MSITRRALLGQTAWLLLSGRAWAGLPAPTEETGEAGGPGAKPDLEVELTASEALQPILPGAPTRVWKYTGRLVHGEEKSLVAGASYPGPLFRVGRGQRVRVRFLNQIPEMTVIHWHGLIVPPHMDGHPRDAIGQGGEYVYEFTVTNRAGTYWYHPHPDRRTGPQVYFGLAGFFLVSDEEEAALGLPCGDCDLPLVIQDRTFDRDNQLVYLSNMMEQMNGFHGDRILVNGRPDYVLSAATRAYRLRLLNGSNARIYRLAWEDGQPLTVLATDGGLLARPVAKPYILLAPGERIELWADFSRLEVGEEKRLISLPIELGGGMGMMGRGMMDDMMGGMMGGRLPESDRFPILTVRIERREKETRRLPSHLAASGQLRPAEADNAGQPRLFRLAMQHMSWTINGRVFEMEGVTPSETVRFGAREMWEFANSGMGMMGMMSLPHPMHLHGARFQVVERSGSPYAEGYVDEGWKDTVLVMPGERVRILVEFADFRGLYLYHCHNLEHEDQGLMRNYLIA